VSYSRHDVEAVTRIVEALKRFDNITVFKDTEDILPTEEWRRRLEGLIVAADTIVFCLSPNSVASEVCAWEVATAERLNKRIAPLVIERVDSPSVPDGLSKLNYIFATGHDDFGRAIGDLASAIGTDINWIREHTRIGELTQRWLGRGEPKDALLRGRELEDAEKWASYQPSNAPTRTSDMSRLLQLSRNEAIASERRSRRTQVAIYSLMIGVITALTAVIFREFLIRQYDWYVRTQLYARNFVYPYVLSPVQELSLKPGESFRDCAPKSDICQDMVVLPRGEYWMGLPEAESNGDEVPRHRVKIGYSLAVAKFDVTWEAWDRCVALGGCSGVPQDAGFGRQGYPLINVSWHEAKAYVEWLARVTGKPYRLLTEAEWEYAARGVTSPDAPHPTFPWGNDTKEICRHANLADRSYRTRYYEQYENCDDGHISTSPSGERRLVVMPWLADSGR
jgi:formylglycine-generating enzyme required for sulfatase activity